MFLRVRLRLRHQPHPPASARAHVTPPPPPSCLPAPPRAAHQNDDAHGITECEVVRWLAAPASSPAAAPTQLRAFDPLCEVQSDKASVELTSPWDGVLRAVLVPEGAVARVGEGLCLIDVEEEEDEAAETSPASTLAPTPTLAPALTKEESVVENEFVEEKPARHPHPLDPAFTPSTSTDMEVLATPAVRHLARARGVDLAGLAPGSGRAGRVERGDVEAFLAAQESGGGRGGAKDVVLELGRTRYAMWRAMEKRDARLTALNALMPVLNAHIPARFLPSPSSPSPSPSMSSAKLDHARGIISPPGVSDGAEVAGADDDAQYARLTYLPFLLKTLAAAMMEWPLFRSSITPVLENNAKPKPTLTLRPHADIALALSTPTGLYAPVLRAADTRSVYELGGEVERVKRLGRRVPPRGATLTVSNIGAAGGGRWAAPVLVPGGGVAIVALGRAEWVWDVGARWWDEHATPPMRGARRLQMNVSWAADHRVVEGAELAGFVECWRGWVEAPGRMVGGGV
ncbi:2-oxoacid dehydrogenases acyltransferase-domain-containing protein [Mycena sp. CBHHK59/15]|nr:2-oxoacid dehydrogenases acyltransferase-domain-containing protein [Mycena sp. CBHHK59/15]